MQCSIAGQILQILAKAQPYLHLIARRDGDAQVPLKFWRGVALFGKSFGATTGGLVIATMVASLINKNADLKIKVTSSLASLFVVTQIVLGAMVIDLKLHAVLVAIHLGIGILLFSMVLLTTLFAFRISRVSIKSRV